MKQYKMDDEIYQDIWVAVKENKKREITHHVLDRWLSIFHGLTAISDECDDNNCYPFKIRDEEKFTWSLLRYS